MKVQISHRGTDVAFVETLQNRLYDIDVIARRDHLRSPRSEKNPSWLDQELQSYDFVIVVLSKAYLGSSWLQKELFACMAREHNRREPFVIPVQVGDCDVHPLLKDRVIDFRNVPFDEAFSLVEASLNARKQLFVIMKFGTARLDSMYDVVIRPTAKKFGYSVVRIDEIQDSGVITEQILKQIERSAIVLADLTGERPNCYFEVGYAHALGKDMILTVQEGSQIHFDLAAHRFIQWSTEKELATALKARFKAIRDRHVVS